MRVVVTGGAGFIGRKLCAALAHNGHDVVAADIVTPKADQLELGGKAVVERLVDVLSFDSIDALCRTLTPEAVIHLAGPVVETVRKSPARAAALQLDGTLNVLEACRLRHVPRVLLASSFYVYAACQPEWVVNEETPLDVRDMELFGAAKLMSERLVSSFAKSYGLRYGIFRFGSVYGFTPGAAGSNVIRTFLEQGFKKEPITVWGPGRRRNQYTYIDDVVFGVVNVVNGMTGEASELDNQVWNLVSPHETTTGELAKMLTAMYGFEFIFDEDKREGPSMAFMASVKAVRRGLFEATRLDKGVMATVDQMRTAGVVAA